MNIPFLTKWILKHRAEVAAYKKAKADAEQKAREALELEEAKRKEFLRQGFKNALEQFVKMPDCWCISNFRTDKDYTLGTAYFFVRGIGYKLEINQHGAIFIEKL